MIQLRDLDFEYPGSGFRLRVPELNISSGEHVALVGPSGSGKTTLLQLIAGIRPVQRGELRVADQRLDQLNDAARRAFRLQSIGLVFQDFALLDYLNVRDNILLPYRLGSALTWSRDLPQRAEQLAVQLGLSGQLLRGVQQLSQGEKQRVAVCRALLPKPRLLLADEPTGNLDVFNKHRVLEAMLTTAGSLGTTVVVVTHDLALLDRFHRVVDFSHFLQQREGR